MECREYALLVSRYVDDDLDGPEADELLRHLSGCPTCRSELGAVERLRSWLRAAEVPQDVLEMFDRTTLADCVETWEPPVLSLPQVSRSRQWGAVIDFLCRRPLEAMGRFSLGPAGLRFALPLLLLGVAAGFWLARSAGTGKTVDVRQLPSAVAMQTSLVEGDREPEPDSLYVLEHASQQPWVRYGDELPMIQLVSEGTK